MKSSETRGTLAYFKRHTWRGINRRVVNSNCSPQYKDARYVAKGIRLEMSKDDFYRWCDEHESDIMGLYQSGRTPSIDRIDSDGHYRLDNIRVLSTVANACLGGRLSSHKCRLSEADVLAIRRDIAARIPQRVIAAKFGVSGATICAINRGRIRRDVI